MQGTPHTSQIIGAFEGFCPPLSLHSCSSCILALCFCPLKWICNASTSEHQIWQSSHLGFLLTPALLLPSLFIFMNLIFALCWRPFRCCCIVKALEQLALQRWQIKLSADFLILLTLLSCLLSLSFLFKDERGLVGMPVVGRSFSPWVISVVGVGLGHGDKALLWRFGFPLEHGSWEWGNI